MERLKLSISYHNGAHTYWGMSTYRTDCPMVCIAVFDGEVEVWSVESLMHEYVVLRYYRESYGREPESVKTFKLIDVSHRGYEGRTR